MRQAARAAELPDRLRDQPEDEQEFVRTAMERFESMSSYWSKIHAVAKEDDQFVGGQQWPDLVRQLREDKDRPVLTYNLFPAFIKQIVNNIRQDRPQLRVVPVETNRNQTPDVKNVQGTKDYSLADVYMGIIRNIEHVSRATHAYDTAVDHAATHGFGFWRIVNRYTKNDPFVQELLVKRVKDSYSVYLDPNATELDFSDAEDAFVFVDLTHDAYEQKYPDHPVKEFNAAAHGLSLDKWYNKETVRVAEYFYIEHRDDEVLKMSNGSAHYLSEVGDVLDELWRNEGIHVLLRKKVKRPVCMYARLSALEVLEGPLELPFQHIPIVAVMGDERLVDGHVHYESAIRHAKDAQRSYNYWRTAAVESVALAPKTPFIAAYKQIEGHEEQWETANTENWPVLLYNPVDGVPPPMRQPSAQPAAAELANASQDAADMQSIIGLHDANLGRESNEKSGRAIQARVAQGATSTFHFLDNLQRGMEHMGRIMLYAIPRLYDTERIVRIRTIDDTEDFVEINKSIVDDQTGKTIFIHDINYGKYDAVVDTGPSYATQRQEAMENQLELLKVLPEATRQAVIHLIVKNMAVPGADEIYRILRKMLPDELKSEDDRAAELPKGVIFDKEGNPVYEESGEPYQPQPTPEQQMAQAAMELQKAELAAKNAKAEADMAKAQADMAEAQAKMQEIQNTINAPAQPGEAAPAIDLSEIDRMIKEVMAEHEAAETAHADTIDDRALDAVMEAISRVKDYVDRKVAEAQPSASRAAETPAQPVEGAPVKSPQELEAENPGVVVALPTARKRIEFQRDAQGRLRSAVVTKIAEPGAQVPENVQVEGGSGTEVIEFERDGGEIVAATVTPDETEKG